MTLSSPAARIIVAAALFLPGIDVMLPITGARAQNNCLTAPSAAAPNGQHWYYSIDKATQRKCWYLRPLRDESAAPLHAAPSDPSPAGATQPLGSAATPQATNSVSSPQRAVPNSNSASRPASTQPALRWCAYFTGGPSKCDFGNFKDCLEAIKGKTAVCVQNIQDSPPAR
jgi:hypothetical protein